MIADLQDSGQIWDADFIADGSRIVTTCVDGQGYLYLWNSVDGSLLDELTGNCNRLTSVKYSKDGSKIIGSGYESSAWLYDGVTGELITTFVGHSDRIRASDIRYDGQRVVTAGMDKTVRFWDANGQLIATSTLPDTGRSVTYSPDGSFVAVLLWNNNTVSIWDGESGKFIRDLEGHSNGVNAAVFSPDSRYLVTASRDNTIKVWDMSSFALTATLVGHTGPINSVAFNANGTRIASGSDDNTVRVWNFPSNRLIFIFSGHTDDVRDAEFSPDGRFVVSAALDNTIRVWRMDELSIERKLAEAVRRAARSFYPFECQLYFPLEECPNMPANN